MKTIAVETDRVYRCKILFEFVVLYEGWDCDSKGYIVKHKGKKKIVFTRYGSPYFADISQLEHRIVEYQNTIKQTEIAIQMIKET